MKIIPLVLCTALLLIVLFPVEAVAFPKLHETDFIIDVGHGGIDGGTSYGELLEKDINLQIGKQLAKKLKSRGFQVILTRNDDRALSSDNQWSTNTSRHSRDLAQRTLLINELHPKAMISLHCNWAKNQAKHGPIILYPHNQPSYILANLLQNNLNKLYSTSGPPYLGDKFYILNHSSIPAVIVEMGFISNADDRRMLTEPQGQQKLVDTISSALWEYVSAIYVNQKSTS